MKPTCLSQIDFKWILTQVLVIITLYPLIFVGLFVVVPAVSLVFLVVRFTVGEIAKNRKGLRNMVDSASSVFLQDEIYSQPKCNIVFNLTVEGNIDVNQVRETLRDKVLNSTDSQGSLKHPKLRQKLVKIFGYYFWEDDNNFDINNHVKMVDTCKETEAGGKWSPELVRKMHQHLANEKWAEDKPFWDITVIHNCEIPELKEDQPHSIVLFRAHHILGDGYATLSFIQTWMTDLNIEPSKLASSRLSENSQPKSILHTFGKLCTSLMLPFRISLHVTEIIVMKLLLRTEWTVSGNKSAGLSWTQYTPPIPMQMLKDIKNHFQVSFSALVCAILAGANKEMLLKRDAPLPNYLSSGISLPQPGNTGKTFKSSLCVLKLPIEGDDPVERLLLCHEECQRRIGSLAPAFAFAFLKVTGLLPPAVMKWTGLPSGSLAFIFTNVSTGDLQFYGEPGSKAYRVNRFFGTSGTQSGDQGVFMGCVGYGNIVTISTAVDRTLMNEEESSEFSSAILNQVYTLHNLTLQLQPAGCNKTKY